MRDRRRFVHPHVDAQSCDVLRFQRGLNGVLVQHAAARRGDDDSARLHHRQFLGIDQIVRFLVIGAMQRQKARFLEQRGEINLGGAPRCAFLGTDIRIVRQHLHFQSFAADARHPPADIADADQADGALVGVPALENFAIHIAFATQRAVGLGDILGE